MALYMILRNSSSLVSLFLFVTSAKNFILRTLSSSSAPFVSRFFQDGGTGTRELKHARF